MISSLDEKKDLPSSDAVPDMQYPESKVDIGEIIQNYHAIVDEEKEQRVHKSGETKTIL